MADEFEVLTYLRAKDQAERHQSPRLTHPGELPFRRAWAIALNRSWGAETECLHLASCRRCSYRVQSCKRWIRHLPWWELLCHVLDRPSREAGDGAANHLEVEQCEQCRARCALLRERIGQVMKIVEPLKLPDPAPFLAEQTTEALDRRFPSHDPRGLEGRLVQRGDRIQLLVRTKYVGLSGAWLGYSLHGGPGSAPLVGFTVFHPDVNDWLSAGADFSLSELHQRLQGVCQELLLSPARAEELTAEDAGLLEASIPRCLHEEDRVQLRDFLNQL